MEVTKKTIYDMEVTKNSILSYCGSSLYWQIHQLEKHFLALKNPLL